MTDYQIGVVSGVLGMMIFRKMLEYAFMKLYPIFKYYGLIEERHQKIYDYLESKYVAKP